jgi:hypothetical protein
MASDSASDFTASSAAPAPVTTGSETDRAAASILHATAQTLQLDNKMKKEQLKRELEKQDRQQLRQDDADLAMVPAKKRDREYSDAKNEAEHAERMAKLTAKQDNDQRTFNCALDYATKQEDIRMKKNCKSIGNKNVLNITNNDSAHDTIQQATR